MYNQDEQNKNELENAEAVENTNTTENVEANENIESAENVEVNENTEANDVPAPPQFDPMPKPKKSKKGLIAILVVVAVLIASVGIFWKPISNFALKTIKSPEEYYAYVEKKNLENSVEAFYKTLEAYEVEEDYKLGSKYSLKLETGEGLSDVVSLAGIDPQLIDWLKSIELAGKINASQNDSHGNLQGLLNDKELFDLSFMLDSKNKVIYASLPILTGDKYIKFDFNEYTEMMKEAYGEDFDDSMLNDDMFKTYDITEFLPEEEVAEALLLKYFDIFVANLGKAEKKNDKLTIGNATQSCTLITYEIDEVDFYNASKAVLEEIKADKEIEKIVKNVAEKMDSDSEEVYSSFIEVVENAIKELTLRLEEAKEKSEEELAKETVTYKVWISSKGEPVARAFEVEEDKFFTGTVKDGKNVASEISIVSEGKEEVKFEGKAVISSKNLSGEYKLLVEGKEILVLDMENVPLMISEKTGFQGKFTFSIGKDVTALLEEEGAKLDKETKEYIETAKIIINAEKNSISCAVETKGKTVLKMTVSLTEDKFETPSYPDESKTVNALDEEALAEMLSGFDADALLNKLKEAGVPEGLIESILGDTGSSGEPGISETPTVPSPLAGTYDVTIWVSQKDGVDELTQKQINKFMAMNPGVVINSQILCVFEGEAAAKVVADIDFAPDIYCFTQEQLARLVMTDAIAAPEKSIRDNIIAINTECSVKAAAIEGRIYAYPYSADNGYYMYYDKSIISEEDAKSLEKLIAACETNNRKFRFNLEYAWYTASFFFATGCKSEWGMNEAGEFVAIDDDFNSQAGLIAMKGMQKLTKSIAYDSKNSMFEDTGVIITGIWDDEAARKHFGENYAVAELPSFTVDGKSYHLGSYSGYKLMGVKPQSDAKKAAVLSLLAQYLTGEECQKERFCYFGWGPSSKALLSEYVSQTAPALVALAEQSNYSTPQRMIHGSWWDIAKVLGRDAKEANNENDLIRALSNYERSVKLWFPSPKDEWSVIGNICYTVWDTDFIMTKISDTVWESNVLELKMGQEFKVRQGASWDINFGQTFNGANMVVPEDGNYIVRLTWYGGENGTVELLKQ